MNRFVSVKNCYKLCHPYYRQQVIESDTPNTLEWSIVTGSPVLMPQEGTDSEGNIITTMVPVMVKGADSPNGVVREESGYEQQSIEPGVDTQVVMIQPSSK